MPLHQLLRSTAAGLCLLLASTFATAADAKKPALLTEKEIADGWVLLFDGETTFGWTGKATVAGGALAVANGEATRFSVTLPAGELAWAPGEVPLTLRHLSGVVEKVKQPIGAVTQASACVLEVDAQDGFKPLTSLKFRPTKAENLLNGKDLTGWKVFKDEKRAKSTFAVTSAGELSVKNGPGDLQSEKQFDDFLLQLECKTNGTALNSGVFFRCIADQYQNGYELQVQNAFKDGDRTKPADFGTGAIYRRIPARKVVSNDNEWFSMTLLAVGPNFATWVNGYPVVSWKDERPANDNPRQGLKTAKGHLSIQGHDPTTDLLFRNLRIVEVK
ncbi:3-keto-disaccharide hydrolase [Limnoglobus roseus]|uniref:Putative beta-jelly-roll-type glycoside hydrolase n=1 Tax=Limnoglobus roseus TaxID=2598579 RepID=A0A5C1A939_9BACT|nr:DUF1080 domain-containing protein [Limnoglobus roseus]QEL14723.1 putative beta-jelly-roll-type glycoside hydrolase [Limnoglobus roseus]